ncbi:MAG: hypothetical protein FWE95_11900, partial [Planctomycetaceae bacterium]|nr:hypothetical protein [Planctomycetaceae bacterium]
NVPLSRYRRNQIVSPVTGNQWVVVFTTEFTEKARRTRRAQGNLRVLRETSVFSVVLPKRAMSCPITISFKLTRNIVNSLLDC